MTILKIELARVLAAPPIAIGGSGARHPVDIALKGNKFYHFPPVHYYLLWEWERGSRRKRLLVELLAIHGFNHELPTKTLHLPCFVPLT